jgi:hypothetical protein
MNLPTIAISLEVIRDHVSQFDKMYRKIFIHNPSLMSVDENFRYSDRELSEVEIKLIEDKQDELITYPLNTYDLSNHYRFDTIEEFKIFFYQDYALEIFGSAQQFHGAMDAFNVISNYGVRNKLYNTCLFSKESDFSSQATYHFLSKTGCRARNIKFFFDESEYSDSCDILITSSPIAIQNKKDKTIIKINREYNVYEESVSDYNFETLNLVTPTEILNILNKNKQ